MIAFVQRVSFFDERRVDVEGVGVDQRKQASRRV